MKSWGTVPSVRTGSSQLSGICSHVCLQIPVERCPSIHIITPETILGGPAKPEAVRFLINVANSPSSYYLLAREGQISVVPAVEHGLFFATGNKPTAFVGTTVTTVAASAISPSRLITPDLISDFENDSAGYPHGCFARPGQTSASNATCRSVF